MNKLIGVTGGIGAGKSTVVRMLEARGAETVDCDGVVHGLYQPGQPLAEQIIGHWGAEVDNGLGGVDRNRLAQKVFGNPDQLACLNALVHPVVKTALQDRARQCRGALFCAVPLLFEVGWEVDMAMTITVWCDRIQQRARLESRGWSAREIDARLASQMAPEEKLRRADYGLINNGPLDLLRRQVDRLLAVLPPAGCVNREGNDGH